MSGWKIPQDQLTGPLRQALERGRYEQLEVRAVGMHLRADDHVLELGAGCGFGTIHAARIVGCDHVVSVEPNPAMIPVIAANLKRDGLPPVTLVQGAVVAGQGGGTVPLYLHGGFWAASLDQRDVAGEAVTEVPALGLADLIAAHDPTVLVADLEGAEVDVIADPLPGRLRLVILELHPKRYGAAGIRRIFDGLSASGLAYCPQGSQGKVVVFQRVPGG